MALSASIYHAAEGLINQLRQCDGGLPSGRPLTERNQLIPVTGAVQARPAIMVQQGKQAGADLAVWSGARASNARRTMRHGRDDADFAQAVIEGVTPGGLTSSLEAGARDETRRRIHPWGRQRPATTRSSSSGRFVNRPQRPLPAKRVETDDLVFTESAQKNG